MRLLLVEDDAQIADSLARGLRRGGDTVDVHGNGRDADAALRGAGYDLMILDLGLPDRDGTAVLSELRGRDDHTPVLVLTARDELSDRVRALDLGADDYLTKPFEFAELQARIRAIARRAIARAGGDIGVGSLRFNQVQRQAYADDAPLDLPPRELAVLEVLLLRRGRVVSKAQIQQHLCDWDQELTEGAIELYVHRVRKKLEGTGVTLRTVRGLGYLLQHPDG
jgi:DNA-binding response OmpR family regulator